MILTTLLLNLSSYAVVSRHSKMGISGAQASQNPIECKQMQEVVDKCNVCTYTLCTDKKKQWEEGPRSCTFKICSRNDKRNEKPYDPKLWPTK